MTGILLLWLVVAVTMPTPRHATSFVVQLRAAAGDQADAIDEALRGLPGVHDVVILEDARTAYLKVDRLYFDEGLLADFPFVSQGNAS